MVEWVYAYQLYQLGVQVMSKSDIMSNSLDQLIDKFNSSPEAFDLVDKGAGVMWQTKIPLSDNMIVDPAASQRSVLITWSSFEKALCLRIYNKTFDTASELEAAICDAKLELNRPLEKYRRNYRKFKTLTALVKKQREHNKTKEFLTKLSSVFPTVLDHFLLGK